MQKGHAGRDVRAGVIGMLSALVLALALAPTIVRADPNTDVGFRGWGPRLGLSINPDQFHFGAHLDFGNFAQHVRFQPNFEMGFGDNLTLATVNAEAAYRFRSDWSTWTPYLGGGLGANFARFDGNHNNNDWNSDVGVNALGGIERGLYNGDRFFVEAKFSLNDIPDAKITIGWTFYH